MYRIAFFIFVSIIFTMCASSKRYTLEELPEKRLYFSFGGGFTGEYQEYMVLPNGQLFYRKKVVTELPFREYEGIDPKVAKDIFETYSDKEFDTINYNDPGNMTYTITMINAEDSTSLVWGGTEVKPNEMVRTYWRRFMREIESKESLSTVK